MRDSEDAAALAALAQFLCALETLPPAPSYLPAMAASALDPGSASAGAGSTEGSSCGRSTDETPLTVQVFVGYPKRSETQALPEVQALVDTGERGAVVRRQHFETHPGARRRCAAHGQCAPVRLCC